MRHIPIGISVMLAVSLCRLHGVLGAQTVETAGASLTVTANVDSAWIFLDTTLVGRTPLTIDTVPPGTHRIRVIEPDVEGWLSESREDTVVLNTGEQKTMYYELKRKVIIHSIPFGANVLLGDSTIGQTPFLFAYDSSVLARGVQLRKDGFEPAGVVILNSGQRALSINLTRVWDRDLPADYVFRGGDGSKDDNLKLYITGAATVLSGAAAAAFKIRADNRYAMYQRTGDSALLSETRRLDAAAAAALVATQIGLGLFTYFILSE